MTYSESTGGEVRLERQVRRIFVFNTLEKNKLGLTKIVAIPEDRIETMESYYGSHNVYLKINGIETSHSFDAFVAELGQRINVA